MDTPTTPIPPNKNGTGRRAGVQALAAHPRCTAATGNRLKLLKKVSDTFLAIWVMLLLGGCSAYQFGAEALYPRDIRTVHIPVVRNESFRHDLGPQLTDALVKEVERRTPYKVVSNPNADSVLRCNITAQSKVVLTETSSDDPRALDSAITVGATSTARDGRRLMQNSLASVENDSTGFSQSVRFVPEAGQSIDTANQEAINQLARRIVSQMESRW